MNPARAMRSERCLLFFVESQFSGVYVFQCFPSEIQAIKQEPELISHDLTLTINTIMLNLKSLSYFFAHSFFVVFFLAYVHTRTPIGLCTLIHPGVEDSTNGSPKLLFGILWELFTKLQVHHALVGFHQTLQVFCKQLAVLHKV